MPSRLPRALAFALLALSFTILASRSASAQVYYEEPSPRDIVVAYNTGLRFSIMPGVFIPSRGGDVGFSIAADGRYGFETGPVILAPGVRLGAYFLPEANVFAGLGTFRVTVPLGRFAPYVLGGVGPGYVSEPSKVGAAYLGGGGFMVHIGTRFGIGAEATYQGIGGTGFRALFVGPSLLLSF